MVSKNRRDSVGGGVVAEFFRRLINPTRFSGGGVVPGIALLHFGSFEKGGPGPLPPPESATEYSVAVPYMFLWKSVWLFSLSKVSSPTLLGTTRGRRRIGVELC